MRVKMLQDAPGSPDGVTVIQYLEGKVHDLGDGLAEVFVREGLAEKVQDKALVPKPKPVQTKKAAGPTENKAAK